jgi:uncharacterized protein YkuJ
LINPIRLKIVARGLEEKIQATQTLFGNHNFMLVGERVAQVAVSHRCSLVKFSLEVKRDRSHLPFDMKDNSHFS